MAKLSYQQRLEAAKNPLLKKLFDIIVTKKSNLCLAANFSSFNEALDVIDKIGPYICILKTQCERFDGAIDANLRVLYEKKKQYNFLLFEDRKFFDGPETISSIYKQKYVKYVDIVTIAPGCGDDIFKVIKQVADNANLEAGEHRGCFAVCDVSFEGFDEVAMDKIKDRAERFSDVCIGLIGQKAQVSDETCMVKASPGVHVSKTTDGMGQQWNHPKQVVARGADILIVGRGLCNAPKDEFESHANIYRDAGWQAYEGGLGKTSN